MMLLVIMILWAGGSFAMRAQLWPEVNLWHHISLLGMFLLAAGYFNFIAAFLEESNSNAGYIWGVFYIALFVFNSITGLFIPEPVVIYNDGAAQFVYNYSWHIYILLACILPCVGKMISLIYIHCKGNHMAFQQLRPIINGIVILIVGHVATTLPMFSGIPLDIMSGAINALFIFYALYKKRIFRMTVLFTKPNYFVCALVIVAGLSYKIISPLQQLFMDLFNIHHVTILAIAATLCVMVLVLYAVIAVSLNTIFVRNENKQQRKIKELCDEVNHTLNAADILQNLTDTIYSITKIERMLVFVRQEDGDFRVEHTTNPLEEKSYYIRADHPLVNYFKNYHGCVNMQDFSRSTVYRSMWEKEKKLLKKLNADYFAPLSCDDGLVGIVVLPEKKDRIPYQPNDLNLVSTVASLCAVPLKEASIYERVIDEARKDKLTGLINRKYFFELLDREFERFKDTALSLCLMNLDDFKKFNQLYGSQEGDAVIQHVTGILISSLNEICHVARIGGKEFALILPGYDIYSAKLLTENLVAEIGKIHERNSGQVTHRVTVSAGICAAPYMASSAKELFRNAEAAVYTVKRQGKNGIQIYSSDIYRQEPQQYIKYSSGYGENASTIYALTAAIDAKDHYTFQHSKNVAYYAAELAKAAGFGPDLIEVVKEAALLHDIGKIGIREDILNKSGKLTADEYEVMKGHVENAVNIIRYLPSIDYVIPTVLSHHERYDGKGYPRQLEGEEIPIMGRVLCIADSFDAMISERSYKKALNIEESIASLEYEAGKQFDPKLVQIFIDLIKKEKLEVQGQVAKNNQSFIIDSADDNNEYKD